MADKALSALRRDALRYVGGVGGALAVVLWVATSADGLTGAQSLAALAAYIVLAVAVMSALAAHLPQQRFGAANVLTLARGAGIVTLAGFLAGQIDAFLLWVAATLALLCIALDGVDGWLARRFSTASPLGARFDMEVDALLMLILGLLLVASGALGAWVLLIGLARYLFVAAGWLVPALQAPLPYSERRRAICVFQGVGLAASLIPDLPAFVPSHLAVAALLGTAWSFGIDTRYLLRAPAAPAD